MTRKYKTPIDLHAHEPVTYCGPAIGDDTVVLYAVHFKSFGQDDLVDDIAYVWATSKENALEQFEALRKTAFYSSPKSMCMWTRASHAYHVETINKKVDASRSSDSANRK